jgi:hypothetical protein
MTALLRWLVAAAVCATFDIPRTTAAPVPAGGVPTAAALAVVPAQAPIVVQLRGVERTKDRMAAFLKVAVPDFGPLAVAQIDQMLKSGFDGRKLEGLEKDGPVFLAILEMPNVAGGAEPPMAVIARVTGYKAFRDGLLTEDERKGVKSEDGYDKAELNGRETYFIDQQGFAAVTTSKDAAVMLAKKPAGLDSKLSADLAKQFLTNDLSLYVNLAAVNKEYGDQIKSGRELFETALNMAGGADKASMEYVKIIYGGMFQAIEDGRVFLAAVDFRPEGMNLHLQFQVGPDTKTNRLLQNQKPTTLASVGALPEGSMTYTATRITGDVLKSIAPLVYGALAGEGESKAKMEEALKQLVAAGNTGSYSGADMPASGLQLQMFDDPAKAVTAMLALFRAMGEGGTFQNAYVKGKPEIKENAVEHRGFKLSSMHIVWDLDKFADAIPGGGEAAKNAIKKLLGEDQHVWFGTDGKRVVTLTAKNWDAAAKRLDAYLDGSATLEKEPAYALTRKQLPAETSILMLADAGRFTQTMGDYMLGLFKAMPAQLPFNLPDGIKPVKTKISYLGFAITLRAETAGFDMFVPVTGIQEIRKVLMPLFMGGNQ